MFCKSIIFWLDKQMAVATGPPADVNF